MALYMYCTTTNDGMFSSHPITQVVQESFRAFQLVHPMSSLLIVLSHFGTYWILIAAWNASSLQGMLFCQYLYELLTGFVNEYTHHTDGLFWNRLGPFDFPLQTSISSNFKVIVRLLKVLLKLLLLEQK